MERWCGKVAVVTGCSEGIGRAITETLTKHGLIIIGLARRLELLQQIKSDLADAKGQFHPKVCDVSKNDELIAVFDEIVKEFGPIHLLINNAGILKSQMVLEQSASDVRDIFDVNLFGLVNATRAAVKIMMAHNIEGEIININSLTAHCRPKLDRPLIGAYVTSKHAVTEMCEHLRQELKELKSGIKISNVNPGLVHTQMASYMPDAPGLSSEEIAANVVWILSAPPTTLIKELLILHRDDYLF